MNTAEYAVIVSIVSVLISVGSIYLAASAKKQSRKTALLSSRREAIERMRSAYNDAFLEGRIDQETVNELRVAYQMSRLVFGKRIFESLHGLCTRANTFAVKSKERLTAEDFENEKAIGKEIERILEAMLSESASG